MTPFIICYSVVSRDISYYITLSENLRFLVFVASHLGLKILEEASFLGSSELVNFVDISSVVTKIGLLTTIAFLNVSSSTHVGIGDYGLLNNGLSTMVVNVSLVEELTLVVEVTLAKSLS